MGLFPVAFLYLRPVDDMPEILEVLRSSITIVDIVRVLPDIAREKRDFIGRERSVSIGSGDDLERSIWLFDKPCPSRTKSFERGFMECFLKSFKVSPFFGDFHQEFLGKSRDTEGREWFEIEGMIPDLGGIIEHSTGRRLTDDIFEGHFLELGTDYKFIQIIDIGLMVFPIVKLERFFRDMRHQSIERVRKWGKDMWHKVGI